MFMMIQKLIALIAVAAENPGVQGDSHASEAALDAGEDLAMTALLCVAM